IENCNNPFNADDPAPFTYELTINGQMITENSVIIVPEAESVSGAFHIDRPGNFSAQPLQIYKQEGEDYRQVAAVHNNNFELSPLSEGEYVAVLLYESPPILSSSEPLWRQWLKSVFLPLTALAYSPDYADVVAIPFTVEYESPVPTGASSVLFLPGIQASRLYTEGAFGTEDQVWEPNISSDVEQLEFTDSGYSVNSIYTEYVIDEVNILPIFQGNIYKGFLNMLEGLEEDGIIKDYSAFAYDWRYSVQDIVYSGTRYKNELKSLIDEVESLAQGSLSGQVTIVGHSNGGLLAKVLITELERFGLEHLVDKVVFIGTPHLGTPKAIGTILHGYDQQRLGGIVIDDVVTRNVIKNMPGAYGLLPSEKYIANTAEPIITFSEGEKTQSFIDVYGSIISDANNYKLFLEGADGRVDDNNNISSPYTANKSILEESINLHNNVLDNWSAPNGIVVYDVVGVGLSTIKAIEYRNVVESATCVPGAAGGMPVCSEAKNILRPYAHFTQYGDETVTALSAEDVPGEKYYFDFEDYNLHLINPFASNQHANFTETEQVQSFVKNVITGTSTPIEYFSRNKPNFTTEYEITSIDSPVRVLEEDSEGNQTGVIVKDGKKVILQEIPNSQYFEFAGTKYLIVPKNIDAKVTLYGEDYGGYTLTIATLTKDDDQVVVSELVNAVTTPNLVASFSRIGGAYTQLKTDIDGDGEIDFVTTLDGELVEETEDEVTFDTLRSDIKSLSLSRQKEKGLLLLVNLAEKFSNKAKKHQAFTNLSNKVLEKLSKLVTLYSRKGWIDVGEGDILQEHIKALLNNK
ncbi:hypothetical protein KC872_05090, partial [Candidatus Kaiserbacteria bacterium]|nr:hypothetical protein [Candidatus Kaiserbacteria bacterium]